MWCFQLSKLTDQELEEEGLTAGARKKLRQQLKQMYVPLGSNNITHG